MEIWIPVNIKPDIVKHEIQEWLDKFSQHAYRSIIQDRINSHHPCLAIPTAMYIMKIENRNVVDIIPQFTDVFKPELCAICMEEDINTRQVLSCNHSFHQHCIEYWFRNSNTCPLCRQVVT